MSCVSPLTLSDRIVPCGKCYYCRLRHVNMWVVRLLEQQKVSDTAYFITLTYEDEKNNLESDTARHTPSGRRTLNKRDLQLFFKRLRRLSENNGRLPIKYYAVGEYGKRSFRPHYHAIVFNANESDIRKSWLFGFVHVGTVTTKSIAYCLKYINKGRVVPIDNSDDRLPEFSVMSQKLGASYVTLSSIKYHLDNLLERVYYPMDGGYNFPLPRYLREKIYSPESLAKISAYFEKLYLEQWSENNPLLTREEWLANKKKAKDLIDAAKRMQNYLSSQKEKL